MNYLVSSVKVKATEITRIDVGEGIPVQIWCENADAFKVYGRYDDTVDRELILDVPSPTAFAPLSLMGGTVKPAHRFIEIENFSATNDNIFHILISSDAAKVQAVFGGGGGGGGGGGLSGSGAANQISVWSGAASLTGFSSLTFNGSTNVLKLNGQLGVNLGASSATSYVDINGATGFNQLRLRTQFTPTGGGDSNGNVGDFAWDDNKLYLKTTAGWKEVVLANFGSGGGGGGISGSGAANQLAVWNGATALTGFSALSYNDTTHTLKLLKNINDSLFFTVENQGNFNDSITKAEFLGGTSDITNFSRVRIWAYAPNATVAPGEAHIAFKGTRSKIYSDTTAGEGSSININDRGMFTNNDLQGVIIKNRLVAASALTGIGNPPGTEAGVLETLGPNSSVQIWRRDLSAYPSPVQAGHRAILYHTTFGVSNEFRLFTDSVGDIFSFRFNTNPQPWLRFRGRISFGDSADVVVIGDPGNTDGGVIDVFNTSSSSQPRIVLYKPGLKPANGEGGQVYKILNTNTGYNAQGLILDTDGIVLRTGNTIDKFFIAGGQSEAEAQIAQLNHWAVYPLDVDAKTVVHNVTNKPALVTILSKEDNEAGRFLLRNTSVTIIWTTAGIFGTAIGTPNRINIGFFGSAFFVENKMSNTRTVYIEKKTFPDF
jgi:hypothetical protein